MKRGSVEREPSSPPKDDSSETRINSRIELTAIRDDLARSITARIS